MALGVPGLVLTLGATPALGQAPEDLPVRERPRPDYAPIGIGLAGIFFYPSIGLSGAYNDNVDATETNRIGDLFTVLTPALSVRSDRSWGGWRAGLDGAFGLYAREPRQNYADLSATLGGTYDAAAAGVFSLDGGYARRHEDPSSPDDAGTIEPTVYYRADAGVSYRHRFNRLSVRLDLAAQDYRYDDGLTATGPVDNADRDRIETEQALRLSYETRPGYTLFIRGALNQRTYAEDRDRNGVDRDSDGYRLDAGIALDLTGLLRLELSAGYLSQDYDDPSLEPVDGIAAGARLTWNVTRLTTVTATIDRDVEETTVSGASGRLDTLGRLEVDHELRRNIILSADLGYQRSKFEGTSRVDNIFDAGVSADYLLSPGVSLSASANHLRRASDAAGADFSRNVFRLGLRYGF